MKLPSNWECDWTTSDDSMLLVGVWKHGFGAWEAMAKDKQLPFARKFFLEDARKGKDAKPVDKEKKKDKAARLPNSTHLVRRADQLLKTLRDHGSAAPSTSRNNAGSRDPSPAVGKASKPARKPRPSATEPKPKAKSKDKSDPKAKVKKEAKARAESPRPSSSKASAPDKPVASSSKRQRAESASSDSESEDSAHESMDEDACKSLMRPVREQLKELKKGTAGMSRDQKLEVLKRCLTAISSRVADIVAASNGAAAAKQKLRKHCWIFATYFWCVFWLLLYRSHLIHPHQGEQSE